MPQPTLQFGPFLVDPIRRQLLRDGRVVALNAKPLQTLLVLLAHPGEDVRREDLLREVWPDAIVEENNLSQCISALRKALGEGPRDHQYVVTVPGYGYRFVAPVVEVEPAVEIEAAGGPAGPTLAPSGARFRIAARTAIPAIIAAVGILGLIAFWVSRQGVPGPTKPGGLEATNAAARAAYLKGRFFWNRRTTEGLKRSIRYFDQAVQLDPGLALAHSGRADANALLWEYTSEWRYAVAAKASAETAVRLGEDRAEVLTSRANVRLAIEGDLEGAERDFQRAIELDPEYATARHWYAWCLLALGRIEEATVQLRRAQELDPLSPIITSALGTARYFAGDPKGAMAEYRRALELDPGFARAHLLLGQLFTSKAQHAEAIAELSLARRLLGESPEATAALAYAYGQAGRRADWRRMLDELERRNRSATVPPFAFAVTYAGAGEVERAIAEVQRACREHSVSAAIVRLDPRLAPLRALPHYPLTCP